MRSGRASATMTLALAAVVGAVVACSPSAPVGPTPVSAPAARTSAPATGAPTKVPPARSTPAPRKAPAPTVTRAPAATRTGPDDPRWRFFVPDQTRYRSAWFDGSQRIMVGYGCTPAPFYRPDPRCDGNGFHHGIDVALPCQTTLRAGVNASVIDPDSPGRPGPAYGSTAFRIRVEFRGERYDVLIGHASRVFVRPGDRIRAGERIATAGARGSPDGCHLHFEQRRVDGAVSDAVNPSRLLDLQPA